MTSALFVGLHFRDGAMEAQRHHVRAPGLHTQQAGCQELNPSRVTLRLALFSSVLRQHAPLDGVRHDHPELPTASPFLGKTNSSTLGLLSHFGSVGWVCRGAGCLWPSPDSSSTHSPASHRLVLHPLGPYCHLESFPNMHIFPSLGIARW